MCGVVCGSALTPALWQLSGPLPTGLTDSTLAALQLVALTTGVNHLSTKVLVRQLSLAIGGGAWITASYNCRWEDREMSGGRECYIVLTAHHNIISTDGLVRQQNQCKHGAFTNNNSSV